jgi:hypothetical protein
MTPKLPMQRISREALEHYCRDDRIARLLAAESRPGDEDLTSQRWLRQTPAKRLIFDMLYGDLLDGAGRHVLDVGGGLSALTRRLAARHRYELVELLAHDPLDADLHGFAAAVTFHHCDWWEHDFVAPFDVIVANDLFPNADQRLSLFLERALPAAKEVRLSLTYYNEPRFYLTRRIDADEILCLLAWDGRQTAATLAPYAKRITAPDWHDFDCADGSVFDNGRQVVMLSLLGDLADD